MSLTIIKAGILDTIQDGGRYGSQRSGINPGGVMDRFSAQLSNCLLDKEINSPVIEMHFPAPIISFNEPTIICITGADFTPVINKKKVPLNQPLFIKKEELLEFKKVRSGARCYLSTLQNFKLTKWLNSYSTNLKANAGGFEGRALKSEDVISFEENVHLTKNLHERNFKAFTWRAEPAKEMTTDKIEIIAGNEFAWLDGKSKQLIEDSSFRISNVADRMGYRLLGNSLHLNEEKQLVSSAVSFGTLQLLPNGQLIALMADHQTTGGYPRIAHIISAHLPILAQMKPNDEFAFRFTDIETAEQKIFRQQQYLRSVKHASSFKIKSLLQ